MKLPEKHINFKNKCRKIIGEKIQKIEYAEINYNPEKPTPFFETRSSKIHTIDYSIFFITEKNTIEFYWDSEFTQYALGIKINEKTIFTKTIKWNLSENEFWKNVIGQKIKAVEIGWENEFGEPYPQFITIKFENTTEIYISAAEFINDDDKIAFGFKDNLLVSNDKKIALENKIIM